MKYINATEVLPKDLLLEIQKHIQGETLYIPIQKTKRKKWGSISGSRLQIEQRNQDICKQFKNGMTVQEISEIYFLSIETIKKIVFVKK